jgi:tRNA(Arg) A34 adenosine deaminase TadA
MTHHDAHLARCVELAREALDAGDDPFGSVLVDADDNVVAEARQSADRSS